MCVFPLTPWWDYNIIHVLALFRVPRTVPPVPRGARTVAVVGPLLIREPVDECRGKDAARLPHVQSTVLHKRGLGGMGVRVLGEHTFPGVILSSSTSHHRRHHCRRARSSHTAAGIGERKDVSHLGLVHWSVGHVVVEKEETGRRGHPELAERRGGSGAQGRGNPVGMDVSEKKAE